MLAGIFALFNIGVPVVIAACPMLMEKPSTSSCCAEKQSPIEVAFNSLSATSCCTTIVAAEPNKTEFLQTKEQNGLVFKSFVIVLSIPNHEVFGQQVSVALTASHLPSVLQSEDIPIFTSSLLI